MAQNVEITPHNRVVKKPVIGFEQLYYFVFAESGVINLAGLAPVRVFLYGGENNVEGVTDRILDLVDVLVDGPFMQGLKDLRLRFRGSSNQRILTKEDIRKLRSSEASG